MKVLQFHEYGGPEVLKFEEAPIPEPGKGQVRVRVSGSGINPVDWKIREGRLKSQMPLAFPHVVGREFSGTIDKLGEESAGYAVGDDVYGIEGSGTCAEFLVSVPGTFAKTPANYNLAKAGGVPLASMTAWQGLFEHGGLKAGQKVLIHAATGGVGTFAVQLAKVHGAYVYATSSAKNLDTARRLGADRAIDYHNEMFEEIATDVDVVLDLVGGEIGILSLTCLKPGGIIVSAVHDAPEEEAKTQGKRTANFMMQPSPEQLLKIGELICDGKVFPVLSEVVPFKGAIDAQKEVQKGHTVGKIVVDLRT